MRGQELLMQRISNLVARHITAQQLPRRSARIVSI